jgi:uncharacterized protein YydD (DUF2326 family)
MTEIEYWKEEYRKEKLVRLQAQLQALDASIVASEVQRSEVLRQLKEMGWPKPPELLTQSPAPAIK